MRAYKFLDAHFGLKSLSERRLKISRIHELNDPFELAPYDITDATFRKTFFATRDDMDKEKGLVCFSEDWRNPLIWAHYSDKQKGMCLGFQIPEMKGDPENDESGRVTYEPTLLSFPLNFSELSPKERFAHVWKIPFTKFADWVYEHEIRLWATLEEEENGLYFLEFGEKLHLTEVILGQRCTLSRQAISEALRPLAGEVTISKARAAYDKFEMVQDEEYDTHWRRY